MHFREHERRMIVVYLAAMMVRRLLTAVRQAHTAADSVTVMVMVMEVTIGGSNCELIERKEKFQYYRPQFLFG